MSLLLILVCGAFVLALLHGLMVTAWRSAAEEAFAAGPADPVQIGGVKVRVLVPVRNGEGTIVAVLQDLHAQHMPREAMEVVVINDHSTDGTMACLQSMRSQWPALQVLDLPADHAGKKAAIERGVGAEGPELILVTDADVRFGPERVATVVQQWSRSGAHMLLAPVHMISEGGILALLQCEEQAALQGATAGSAVQGSPLLANGANMAFTRTAFREVGGFTGDRWASGDDMTLLARMRRAGRTIGYVADARAAVFTRPEPTMRDYFEQRIRWAGKMRAHPGSAAKVLPAVALFLPWSLLALTLPALQLRVGEQLLHTWSMLLFAWAAWAVPVVRMVRGHHRNMGTAPNPVSHTVLALLWFAAVSPLIAVAALWWRPVWKGRRLKR